MAQNEDVEYTVSDFATEDFTHTDPDQPNKSVLQDVVAYIDERIAAHNTFDVIDLSDKTLNPTQQIAVHKQVTIHLRNIKSHVDGKLKELI